MAQFRRLRTRHTKSNATQLRSRTFQLQLQRLEDRTVPAVTDLIVTGAGAGGGPHIKMFDAQSGALKSELLAYNPQFTGGVRVALADVTGDGVADLITGPGPGGAPHIRIFDGVDQHVVREFMAFEPQFTGGVNVAAGDFDGDGKADIVVTPDYGGGPVVRVFSGATGSLLTEFLAYDASFRGGTNVAVGDVTGDSKPDIVTGAGNDGAPHVKVFDGSNLSNPTVASQFFAYDTVFRGGVYVAAIDRTANSPGLVVTGAGIGGGPHVKAFDITHPANPTLAASFMAYPIGFTGGVHVSTADINGDGTGEILVGPGIDTRTTNTVGPELVIASTSGAILRTSWVYATAFNGGVFVGGTIQQPVAPPNLPQGTLSANPATEGSTSQVGFTNVTGGTGGYRFSFDFDNDGNFDVSDSTSASATIPAAFLADGPGTRTIRGRIRDNSGTSALFTTTVSIANINPTIQLGSSFTGTPGVAINFPATVTDPSPVDTAAGFTYVWNFGDGSANSTLAAPSHAFAAAGSYVVTLQARDKDGGTSTATATVNIASNPPVGTFTAGSANEGGTGSVGFTNVTGGSGGNKFSFDFDNNGTFEVTDSTSASATVPASFLADGPGSRTIRGRVKDSSGSFSDYTATMTITNVPPTVQFAGTFGGAPGTGINLSVTVTDPSPTDTAAGFTYSWDFGDGTATGTAASPNHVYATSGYYTATVTVRDKDGGSASASTLVTVGATASSYIVTPYDRIPNFGANPTITATRSGSWSDAGTWSLGRLPADGDIVSIGTNISVTYDVVSDVPVNTVAIQAGGTLAFRTDVNTRLTAVNVLVMPGGTLQIGTTANPVAASVKAEIVIPDQPFDLVLDPAQYGHGLIGLGNVTMNGAVRSDSFIRLATEPLAGATTLQLSAPVSGWRVGDKIVLPDSKQYAPASGAPYSPTYEENTISAISADGRTITLATALQFDHPGAHDGNGNLTFLPHVGNRTRNVVVRSANSLGTRGHAFFTYRANVDIRYAQFGGLGRTTFNLVDSTTFDANGNVTHVGTNQDDRFAVNFSHLYGPQTTPANGYQYTFVGNAVACQMPNNPYKWGVTINDSHYGLIQDNFVYNWAGAGVVTKSGNESFNVIADNFVVRGIGQGDRLGGMGGPYSNPGSEGSAFWFRGPNNYVRDNVGANYSNPEIESAYGFKYVMYYLDNVNIPNFRGADTSVTGQYTTKLGSGMPLLEFARNEAYGVENAVTFWWLNMYGSYAQNGGTSTVQDFRGWHLSRYGLYGYPMNDVVFDGFTIHNEASTLSNAHESMIGMWFGDYVAYGIVVRHADIQGCRTGFIDPFFGGSTTIIEDSFFMNSTDIMVESLGAPGSGPDGNWREPKSLIIRNVRFGDTANWNHGGRVPATISMYYTDHGGAGNLIKSDTVFVYDYNGVAGDNFQVFYNEQLPDFVVPQSSGFLVGSPAAGLTNQENWDVYDIAIAGSIATGTTTRSLITGLVRPI